MASDLQVLWRPSAPSTHPHYWREYQGCKATRSTGRAWGAGTHLHDRAGGQHLLLHAGVPQAAPDGGEVPHGILGRRRLPCTRLTADDEGLIPPEPAGGGHEPMPQGEGSPQAVWGLQPCPTTTQGAAVTAGPPPPQGAALTSPSACTPPRPVRRCGGPCPPSPGRCRHRSPPPRRWAAACRG